MASFRRRRRRHARRNRFRHVDPRFGGLLLGFRHERAFGVHHRGFDRIITNKAHKVNELESEVSTRVQETLEGIPAVQAFCREDTEYKRFRRHAGASLRANLNLNLLQTISQVIIDLFLAGGIAAIVWFAASRVLQGRMTAGDVVLVVSYIWMLYEPSRPVLYGCLRPDCGGRGAQGIRFTGYEGGNRRHSGIR
jgi:ABC-type multidrug transport system fused ATPase/permease subunit